MHRTRNVNYQVLKGMSLVAHGGFFIVWCQDYYIVTYGCGWLDDP